MVGTMRNAVLRHVSILAGLLLASATVAGAAAPGRGAERDRAREILAATGAKGGLIVHLGCGDGRLTAALRVGESFLVHGLTGDEKDLRRARATIRQQGLYGPVSVDRFGGKRLPYAENLVNLIVADEMGGVTEAEAMRVLAPGGVLYAGQGARRRKTVKPRPADTDEWTHFLHDASGNAVARDQVVGPPRHAQWIAGPRHTRSHEHIPSINALVSTGGRIFYIVDQAPAASIRQTPRWHLVARDAYNGILLWKRPVETWFPHIVNWGATPRQLQRRLVAVGNRVYVTLGLHSPLSAVDAITGRTVKVYEQTRGTEEILCHKGVLILAVRGVTDQRVAELDKWARLAKQKNSPIYVRETAQPLVTRLRSIESRAPTSIVALDADSGKMLWKKTAAEAAGLRTLSMSAIGDRVLYHKGGEAVCLDLTTGRKLWSVPSAPLRVVCGGRAVCSDNRKITALSVESGKAQWTQPASLVQIRDMFVINGSLWVGGFKPYTGARKGRRGPPWGPYFATQRDLATGRILKRIEPESPGHHHRCWQNKATERYILGGRRGVEFVDLKTGEVLWHSWVRGVCRYGVMPCNGLLYAPPHACGCYIAAKLTGFNALAPARAEAPAEPPAPAPLERGPAYGRADPQSTLRPAEGRPSEDWPTYRHDARRSGSTRCAVPAALSRKWQADVGGRLTSPTVGGGKVFVASVDEHRICAIDADSGRSAWQFTTGGRVDSPPTLAAGRAILGCRDGYVYSLRASDGALAWRFRAAGQQRRITANGQLESASPVHGSVLVQEGAAYLTAGRSSYLDGGIALYRIQVGTGKVLSKTQLYSPDPETGKQPKQSGPCYMPGQLGDILTSDGRYVYLRDTVFDKRGRRQPKGEAHLLTLTGFLDGSWPHRSYWVFGTRPSIGTGCSGRDRGIVSGRLLVFDGPTIYGYGRAKLHWSNRIQDGAYRLFCHKRGEKKEQWTRPVGIQVRAMVLAGKVLFVAGRTVGAADQAEGGGGRGEALLMAFSASDGKELARQRLDAAPALDGMAAARGRLYVVLENGRLVCMGPRGAE